jgi:hypothetical protein
MITFRVYVPRYESGEKLGHICFSFLLAFTTLLQYSFGRQAFWVYPGEQIKHPPPLKGLR